MSDMDEFFKKLGIFPKDKDMAFPKPQPKPEPKPPGKPKK